MILPAHNLNVELWHEVLLQSTVVSPSSQKKNHFDYELQMSNRLYSIDYDTLYKSMSILPVNRYFYGKLEIAKFMHSFTITIFHKILLPMVLQNCTASASTNCTASASTNKKRKNDR